MVQSKATTVEQYLAELPDDRHDAIAIVRDEIVANLPKGYEETIGFGMISYVVPLERYPDTYNKQPLQYAALASQKNHMAVYLSGVYGDEVREKAFAEAYTATGKKLDMGKTCVRFKKLEQLPVELIGESIASVSVDEFIERYEIAKGLR